MDIGVIFDFNGVIVADEHLHEESWRILLKDKHISDEEFHKHFYGKREKEIYEYLFDREVKEEELAKYSNQRIEIVKKLLDDGMTPTPGLLPLLKDLKKHSIPTAIGSSSRKPYLFYILSLFKLEPYFTNIVTGEDVEMGKPDPEIFLAAAHNIHIAPEHCVVFEDSLNGITAGKRAGMKVVALTTTHSADSFQNIDGVIPSFEGISLEFLQTLFLMKD